MAYRNGHAIDRRFLDWHYTMPRDFHFMDLDGLGFCARCREPLLLVETSRDPEKATTVIGKLGKRADLRAYLIIVPSEPDVLDEETAVLIRRVWPLPQETRSTTLEEWVCIESSVRKAHKC